MKANSLEELVTNSNIAGELRNYTDWHARLVKFAQLVADWQKERMMKDAVEGEIEEVSFNNGEEHNTIRFSFDEESLHVENRIWFPRSGKDGDKVRIVVLKEEED